MRLAIIVIGGVVQRVVSDWSHNGPINTDIVVIDYDTDGADSAQITQIKQNNGAIASAYVSFPNIGKADFDLEQIFAEKHT